MALLLFTPAVLALPGLPIDLPLPDVGAAVLPSVRAEGGSAFEARAGDDLGGRFPASGALDALDARSFLGPASPLAPDVLPAFDMPDPVELPIPAVRVGTPSLEEMHALFGPQPAAGRELHAPIAILSDEDFTAANGVRSGSGTEADPFVIEDWTIPSVNRNFGGLRIQNTQAHVLVRNVVVQPVFDDGAACRDDYLGLLWLVLEQDASGFLDPEQNVSCLNHFLGGAGDPESVFESRGLAVHALEVGEASHVTFDHVDGPTLQFVGCDDCAVLDGRFFMARGAGVVDFEFARNTFSQFFLEPMGAYDFGADGASVHHNLRPLFGGWAHSMYLSGVCPLSATDNDLRDGWADIYLFCDGPADNVIARNTFATGPGSRPTLVSGGGIRAGGLASIDVYSNLQATYIEILGSGRVSVCDQQMRGVLRLLEVEDVTVCDVSVTDADVYIGRWARSPVAGTTLRFHDVEFVRTSGNYLRNLWVLAVADAVIERVDLTGVALVSVSANTIVRQSVVTDSLVAHTCDLDNPGECRSGTLSVDHTAFHGGNGVIAADCTAVSATENSFDGTAYALVAQQCDAATFSDNDLDQVRGGLVLASAGVTAERNTLTGGDSALYVAPFPGAVVRNNVITGATRPVLIDGFGVAARGLPVGAALAGSDYTGTTVDGRDIQLAVPCEQGAVDAALASAAVLGLFGCSGITLEGFAGVQGLILGNSTDVTVRDAVFTNPQVAIQDYGSLRTRVENLDMSGAGLGYVSIFTRDATLVGNEFTGTVGTTAILYFSEDASLQENDVRGGDGLFVIYGEDDILASNTFSGGRIAIVAGGSEATQIASNEIRDASIWGILVVQPDDVVIRDNTVLGTRFGIGTGNGYALIERNVVLGTYGTASPQTFQDLHDLFVEYALFLYEPTTAGIYVAVGGDQDVRDNVVAGYGIGAYAEGFYFGYVSPQYEGNRFEHNVVGLWQQGAGDVRAVRNDLASNRIGFFAECSNVGFDPCTSAFTENRVASNEDVGIFLNRPTQVVETVRNDFEGNGVGYGILGGSQLQAALPPAPCRGAGNWYGHETGPAADWNPGARGDRIVCQVGVGGAAVDMENLHLREWLIRPAGAGAPAGPAPALAASTTEAPEDVLVDFQAAFGAGSQILWAFGDGAFQGWTTSTQASHAYDNGLRTYPATVVQRTTQGRLGTASLPIAVLPTGPTLALAAVGNDHVAGTAVRLDAGTQGDEGLRSFQWDFGDGRTSTVDASLIPDVPFQGRLYFHGLAAGFDRILGDLNQLDSTAPLTPASRAWFANPNLRGYCCLEDVAVQYDLEPNWLHDGPFFARGPMSIEFWATAATHPVIVDDWNVRIEVDGHAVIDESFQGATLGLVPTRIAHDFGDVRIEARSAVRVFVDADFGDMANPAYGIHYDGTLHPSALVFSAPAAADATPLAAPASGPGESTVPMVVEFEGPVAKLKDDLEALGAIDVQTYTLAPFVFARVPNAAAALVPALPGVVEVHEDGRVEVFSAPSPLTVSGADIVRSRHGLTGQGVTVAIVDTGFDTAHPELAGRFQKVVDLRDGTEVFQDGGAHGTSVAGIVAGSATGVAPGANLVGIIVGQQDSATPMHEVLGALEWIANHRDAEGIRIASLSLGMRCWPGPCDGTEPLSRMADALVDAGVLVVVAGGNSGGNGASTVTSPGDAERVLTVGALDWKRTDDRSDDTIASYSGQGPIAAWQKPDVVAPGVGVPTTALAGGHTLFGGTSAATPHVAGLAALLYEADPELSPLEAKTLLTSTARDAGEEGLDPIYGWGVADVERAHGVLHSDLTLRPDHVFAEPGIYTVTVRVTDADGLVASGTLELPVAAASGHPVARIDAPTATTSTGVDVAWRDTSRDTHGGIVARSWDFGDGTTASGTDVQHAWDAPGTYEVRLTVTNALGHTDEATAQIVVSASPAHGTWYAHGTPYSNQFVAPSPLRDIRMDATAPTGTVPKTWAVLRSQTAPPTPSQPTLAAAWEATGPVHIDGPTSFIVWAGTKQGHPVWVDGFVAAVYADGVRVALREIQGSTLSLVPTELTFAFGDLDVRVGSKLAVAVRPVFHTSGPQNWTDVEDPTAFYYDAAGTPTRLEADLSPA